MGARAPCSWSDPASRGGQGIGIPVRWCSVCVFFNWFQLSSLESCASGDQAATGHDQTRNAGHSTHHHTTQRIIILHCWRQTLVHVILGDEAERADEERAAEVKDGASDMTAVTEKNPGICTRSREGLITRFVVKERDRMKYHCGQNNCRFDALQFDCFRINIKL